MADYFLAGCGMADYFLARMWDGRFLRDAGLAGFLGGMTG